MGALGWLVVLAAIGAVVFVVLRWQKRTRERERAAAERMMAFMAQARPAPSVAPPAAAAPDPSLPLQKLLLEAAAKAGEAGEAALSIQLYARLLARYPQTAFAREARAAVEMQKLKLAKR